MHDAAMYATITCIWNNDEVEVAVSRAIITHSDRCADGAHLSLGRGQAVCMHRCRAHSGTPRCPSASLRHHAQGPSASSAPRTRSLSVFGASLGTATDDLRKASPSRAARSYNRESVAGPAKSGSSGWVELGAARDFAEMGCEAWWG